MYRPAVVKFGEDVVAPRVREMDENEMMDPEVIQGLFDTGVSSTRARESTSLKLSLLNRTAYGH